MNATQGSLAPSSARVKTRLGRATATWHFIKSPDGQSVALLQRGPALPKQEPWASMANQGSW